MRQPRRSGVPPFYDGEQQFDWSLCRTFLAVARRGSIAAATAELELSHPAVRRQLERLEGIVGGPLFHRSQAGMAMTPLAEGLLGLAEDMERSARSMLREAASAGERGVIRIAADGLVCSEVLPSILRTLRRALPETRYEVAIGPSELLLHEADVGLHLRAPTHARLVRSRVATFRWGLFSSPSWVSENGGEPKDLRSLFGKRSLVGGLTEDPLRSFGETSVATDYAVMVETDYHRLSIIEAGLGVGALPLGVAGRHPSLVRLLPDISSTGEAWLSVQPDQRHVPSVRRVMDAMRGSVQGLLA